MRRLTLFATIIVLFVPSFCAAAKPKPASQPKVIQPTKENVLAMAKSYGAKAEAKLDISNKQAIQQIRFKLESVKGIPSEQAKIIDGLVNQLTVSLASLKKFDTITAASAILLQTDPASPRTANLFASVLHTVGKTADSVVVLQYTLSLAPKSQLAQLNLANGYLDTNQDAKAKAIADKIILTDPDNREAWRVIATYWYKRNNMAQFRNALLRSAKFKGYKRKKTENKEKEIIEKSAQGSESVEILEQKCKGLENQLPTTTADIIEDDFPAEAQKIRDKYSKLVADEKYIMPRLPMVNTNTSQDYQANKPVLEAWAEVFAKAYEKHARRIASDMGIHINAEGEANQAEVDAAVKKQMAESLQNAQDMMKYMKNQNIKGVNKSAFNKAMAELEKASKQQGIKLKDNPVKAGPPPNVDGYSELTISNFNEYKRISRTYELYFLKYFQEYRAKSYDNAMVYAKKVAEENKRYADKMKELAKEHEGPNAKTSGDCPRCLKEELRHRLKLNELGDTYYKHWVNLYMPQYAQKMKPNLDAYWNVCALYIRMMKSPKIMKTEYERVRSIYFTYALQAIGSMGEGAAYEYEPITDAEIAEMEKAIAAAEQEAIEKKPQFEREVSTPGTDWTKWIEDHLVFEVAGEFLSLKITAKTIEFEAWAFGPGAGIKLDLVDETMETYTGVGAKLKVGVNIGGFALGAEAKTDFARKTAKWDFANGTYEESYGAKGEAKAAFGTVSAGAEYEVNTQLEAKITAKATAFDMFNMQGEVSSSE